MIEHYNLYAFWGPREEPAGACAGRTLQLLDDLADCHPLFAQWYEKGWSREEALQTRIPRSHEALTRIFEAHRMTPHHLNLGYSVGWWNGDHDDRSMGLHISCGGRPRRTFNLVSLNLPTLWHLAPDLFDPAVLERVITAVVNAWDPDWAELTSMEISAELYFPEDGREPLPGSARVGWFTYLHARRLAGLSGPVPCEVVDLPGRGALFVLTRDHRVSVERPDDLDRVRKLAAVLDAAGALGPIVGDRDA